MPRSHALAYCARMQSKLIVGLIFVIGCIAGGAASQMVVPPARAGTAPTRWEYLCSQSTHSPVDALNKAGEQGWELVTLFPSTYDKKIGGNLETGTFGYCFKRALP
jgi:hypothetical protein